MFVMSIEYRTSRYSTSADLALEQRNDESIMNGYEAVDLPRHIQNVSGKSMG
jgi:hypothetical protein